MRNKGFTLIELLIVIAIIAILALIAIPNFLEAQTRAKVSRCMADLRSLATAMEAYYVDQNMYPCALAFSEDHSYYHYVFQNTTDNLESLTTPVAYVSGTKRSMIDPFVDKGSGELSYTAGYWYMNIQGAVKYLKNNGCDNGGIQWHPKCDFDTANAENFRAPAPLTFNGPDGRVFFANWMIFSAGPDGRVSDPRWDNGKEIDQRMMFREQWYWDRFTTHGSASMYDPTNGTLSRGNIYRLEGLSQ